MEALPTYESLIEFLVEKASPEAILAFKASDQEQQYVQELLIRQSKGELTKTDEQKLERMLQLERLMADLKLKALRMQKNET